MKTILFIISVIFLVSCNPCKFAAKHPECFPPDTVKITNNVIHYEKEYITNDSIIRDTAPCDPITKTYYKTNTVYKTKTVVKIDSIYTLKEVAKVNPINPKLKKANEKLENNVSSKNKLLKILGGISALLLVVVLFLIKFK